MYFMVCTKIIGLVGNGGENCQESLFEPQKLGGLYPETVAFSTKNHWQSRFHLLFAARKPESWSFSPLTT
jgi:hypothetical protein